MCCCHQPPHISQGNCSLSLPTFSVVSLWGMKGELGYEGRLWHHMEYCVGTHVPLSAPRCSSVQYCLNGDSTQLTRNRAALRNDVHTWYEPKYTSTRFKCSAFSLANPPSLLLLCSYGTKLEAVSISTYLTYMMEYLTRRKDIFNLVP